jgi:S1-C subfamily serine protease
MQADGAGASVAAPSVQPIDGALVDVGRVTRRAAVGVMVLVAVLVVLPLAWPASGGRLAGRWDRDGDRRPLGAGERAEMVEVAARGTVAITGRACGFEVTGSGVVIDGGVITNHHVTAGGPWVDVGVAPVADPASGPVPEQVDGGVGWRTAPVAARSVDPDLALVAPVAAIGSGLVGDRSVVPVEVASEDPGAGEPVVVAASYGVGFRWLEGTVTGVVDGEAYGAVGSVLLVDVPTGPGFSGGPVLDRRAELVGILHAVDHSTAQSLAVPVSELSAWLNSTQQVQADISCIND